MNEMRANIPDELIKLIDEMIYLDLEVHILNKKIDKGKSVEKLQSILKQVLDKRIEVRKQLRDQGVKIHNPVSDDMFVRYRYSVKVDGGYKQGIMQYWKDAMKLTLKKRMRNYKMNE